MNRRLKTLGMERVIASINARKGEGIDAIRLELAILHHIGGQSYARISGMLEVFGIKATRQQVRYAIDSVLKELALPHLAAHKAALVDDELAQLPQQGAEKPRPGKPGAKKGKSPR